MASASLLIIKVKKCIDLPPHRCFFPSSYWFKLTEHLLKLERANHVVYILILCHSRETFSMVVLRCLAQVLPSARCHTKCEECSSHLCVFDSFTGVFAVQVYCMHASCHFSLKYSAWGKKKQISCDNRRHFDVDIITAKWSQINRQGTKQEATVALSQIQSMIRSPWVPYRCALKNSD